MWVLMKAIHSYYITPAPGGITPRFTNHIKFPRHRLLARPGGNVAKVNPSGYRLV